MATGIDDYLRFSARSIFIETIRLEFNTNFLYMHASEREVACALDAYITIFLY